jgi:hypothetical protein
MMKIMNGWRLAIDSWPGPNRKKWKGLRDIIEESPNGKYIAVLYSCGEVGINKETGCFALLEEPKDSPRLLLRPRGLTCLALYDPGKSMQWIENRYCVITPYSTKPGLFGKLVTFYGTMVFDVKEHRVSYIPNISPDKVMQAIPDNLSWKSWKRLSWWPRSWLKR